jgi:hypothetical protein
MKKDLRYLQLASGDALPALAGLTAFKVVLVVDSEVHQPWQWDVCRWLVESGARYVMAWGVECEAWHDAVDDAYLEFHNYEDVGEDLAIVTTWHDDEELTDVFWFAKQRASHALDLSTTVILHIADAPDKDALEAAYADA